MAELHLYEIQITASREMISICLIHNNSLFLQTVTNITQIHSHYCYWGSNDLFCCILLL